MKTQLGTITEDFGRELYWVRIRFLSEDETKNTQVLASASTEYLHNLYKIPMAEKLSEEHFSKWSDSIISKWLKLENQLFDQDVHYDVYSNTKEGEANGIDFLISKLK